ncbi:chromosome condensation regulator RCC1, partial [bacterium]|nr:chromosome condensation regulator RCC1 [Candidatus Elulimicrobium humile]
GFTDWIQISAGYMHSLAIRSNGTAWAWGQNRYSQLGINNNVDASYTSPRSIVGGFTDWVQVSAGEKHSLGIRANGTAWGWGYTNNGRVGNNSSSFSSSTGVSSPVSVVGGFTDWVQISAGGSHSAGLRAI